MTTTSRLLSVVLLAGAAVSCSSLPPESRSASVIRAAKPEPTKEVSLTPIKETADQTSAALRRARDAATSARAQADEAQALSRKHEDTIGRLTEKLEANEEVQQDLARLREEAEEYRSLDERRKQVIENLRAALEVAREKLEQLRVTHVPKAELEAAESELEKERLRKLTDVAADTVEDVEADLHESNEQAAKYKSHYDSRWGRFFKIAGGFFLLGIISVFLTKWLLKAGIISLSGGVVR